MIRKLENVWKIIKSFSYFVKTRKKDKMSTSFSDCGPKKLRLEKPELDRKSGNGWEESVRECERGKKGFQCLFSCSMTMQQIVILL